MVIRKIPIYTLETTAWRSFTSESFEKTDFVLTLPPLCDFMDREQTLFCADGALSARMICRSLDMDSTDPEMESLRVENCFIANEKDEWILEVSFTTMTPQGVTLEQLVRLPMSLPNVKNKLVTVWFNGTYLRLLQDGETLNENSGVGDLCEAKRVVCNVDVQIAKVQKSTRTFRQEESDVPADFYDPHGFNTNAGDAMTFFHNGVYHLLYLPDRRHHRSRGGAGAHNFAHITTKDLITWEEQEPVNDIEHPYETFGTGMMFEADGKYYVSYGLHTSRYPSGKFGEPFVSEDGNTFFSRTFQEVLGAGEMPMGATLSVSDDGLHFERTERLFHGSQNPSIYKTKDGFLLYGGYGYQGTYFSESLDKPFTRIKNDFTYCGESTALNATDECPSFFEINGYKYLIVGRTGYFRTLEKDSEKMVDAIALGETIYDGLCVPMVAQFDNGRRIICGWIRTELGWGSLLMQRELVQEEDGVLGMKWIPELYPTKQGEKLTANADGGFALTPKQNYIYEAEVEADDDGIFALQFLGENGLASELRIDVKNHRAQLCNANADGSLTKQIETPYEIKLRKGKYEDDWGFGSNNSNYADCYAMPCVRLPKKFSLRIIIRYAKKIGTTVCDIEMGGCRTMILAKPRFFVNGIKTVHGRELSSKVTPIKR